MSTPVAMAAGIGSAGRHGVLIKGGIHLENLGTVRVVALDKIGGGSENRRNQNNTREQVEQLVISGGTSSSAIRRTSKVQCGLPGTAREPQRTGPVNPGIGSEGCEYDNGP